ncbi:MAG: DNA-directed RNA polymerase subunit delta [Bacilli bacterium]|nr:DNA-directed RNA polymerase subunit delta [Bacilli bacterium]
MKAIKLTDEQLEQYSYADVANLVLEANGKKMKIQNLFEEVIKIMKLPDSFFESKIGDFFALLSTDKRFIMLEKGFWDLRVNHTHKIVIEDEEEEEELELEEEIEDIPSEDEDDTEINFDDDKVDDDDDEDDLKDLVILDESEEQDMM